jgi:soluble lytic murein transglycosylase-like protein
MPPSHYHPASGRLPLLEALLALGLIVAGALGWIREGGADAHPAPTVTEAQAAQASQRPAKRRARHRARAPRGVPAGYWRLYRRAGSRYGVNPLLLAAIGRNETNHGRLRLPGVRRGRNFAGAMGPMQFISATWRRYRTDGNRDGRRSVYDPHDAIPAAARYVRDLRRMVGRSYRLIMAAYNAGPHNVRRYRGVPPFSETRKYVKLGSREIKRLRRWLNRQH